MCKPHLESIMRKNLKNKLKSAIDKLAKAWCAGVCKTGSYWAGMVFRRDGDTVCTCRGGESVGQIQGGRQGRWRETEPGLLRCVLHRLIRIQGDVFVCCVWERRQGQVSGGQGGHGAHPFLCSTGRVGHRPEVTVAQENVGLPSLKFWRPGE